MGSTLAVPGTWRDRRPGEGTIEWQDRLSHSCWKCGVHIRDMAALDAHEETCRPTTKSPRLEGPKSNKAGA